jgi:Golgi phosphoprotein 3 (GPP34)
MQGDVVTGVHDCGQLVTGVGCADTAQETGTADATGQDCDSHPSNLRDGLDRPAAVTRAGPVGTGRQDGHNEAMTDAPTDRLATQLLRVARDPGSGRLRHPGSLAIGLRAALFTDLVLLGRVGQDGPGPGVGPMPATEDRILEAVARTVERRPRVAWWRWYRHVRPDTEALVGELVAAGRWTERPGNRTRAAYDDADEAGLAELTHATMQVAESLTAPRDARQAILAILTVMCGSITGRPRPRALRRDLKPLLRTASTTGERGAQVLPAVVTGASKLLKRPLRRS